MSEHKIPIPSMLYNAAVGGHVTNSQQIIDENENKEQSQINDEVKQILGQGGSVNNRISKAKNDIIGGASSNGNTLKKIEDRVSPLESAIGAGGNIDKRIEKSVNVEKTRAQTAEKDLNSRVNNLESEIGTGGSVDSRITAAKLEIKGNVTSACDTLGKVEVKINDNTKAISNEVIARTNAVNDEATRAQAAEQLLQEQYNGLTQSDIIIGTLPSNGTKNKIYRVPGTNTYSDYMWNGNQFIKMATYDNAIDDEPIVGSENLVKSGGVDKRFGILKDYDTIIELNTITPRNYNILTYTGSTTNLPGDSYDTSDFIDISKYDFIQFNNLMAAVANWAGICLYSENKTTLIYFSGDSGVIDLSKYPTAKWMRYTTIINNSSSVTFGKRTDCGTLFDNFYYKILYNKDFGAITPRNYNILRNNGTTSVVSEDDYDTSNFINLDSISLIKFENLVDKKGSWAGICLYEQDKSTVVFVSGDTGTINLSDYPSAKWMRYSTITIKNPSVKIYSYVKGNIENIYSELKELENKIDGHKKNVIITVGPNKDFTTIQSAVSSITDASKKKNYTVLVDEGDYNISNAGITHIPIRPYINIKGVSKKTRIIQILDNYSNTSNVFENEPNFSGEAEICNLTIITKKSKGALHLDNPSWNGKIHFHDIICETIENENPYNPSKDYYIYMAASFGSINLGLHLNQEIIIEDVYTNGYIYSHTTGGVGGDLNSPSKFIVRNCVCDWIGIYSNGDVSSKTAIIENNKCHFIKIEFDDNYNKGFMCWNNIVLNNNRCSFIQGLYQPYNSGINGICNLWDYYYNKKMICPDKSLHTSVQNLTGNVINRGTKVKFTDYKHRYIKPAVNNNDYDAITINTFDINAYGVVQDGGDLNALWDYIQKHSFERID